MNVTQALHEIEWLKNEITKLEVDLPKRPRNKKQIDQYKHQIKHTELSIMLFESESGDKDSGL